MIAARTTRERGFTLLELVVVIALIGTLIAVAAHRLAGYVDEAERVAVLGVEGRLRNALLLETAQRILRDDNGGVSALEGSNPMRLMLETPYNYAGELDRRGAAAVGRRHWFFDLERGELVYRRSARRAPGNDLRYSVRVAYDDRDGDGRFGARRDELVGVRLVRVN